ncbi:hypothetical protein ADIS_2233 [Lunatimonas lonarensis]|uniref:Outer membrane protein beta-barrel domain-containing protein n=1 Tax=Lunatimonas lonarensis TaxID=1232681 RepID=R7ZTA9_9BACT|nr:hypothetical protein [Lunatimonas lonarensis]EON77365.1 hypothetical protein ADIS_2233 [Lunatimonas lonarensis]
MVRIVLGLPFLLLLFFGCGTPVKAQSYGTAVGIRLGNNNSFRTVGVSAKHRLAKGLTAEGILQSDFASNTTAHLLLARHRPMVSKRFNYYYGGGLSMGVEESRQKIPESMQIIHTYGNPTFGIDGLAGVEMTLLRMTVSLDYKPNLNLTGRDPWYQGQVGLSVRSVMVTGSEQNKRKRQKAKAKRKKAKKLQPTPIKDFIRKVRPGR